LRSFKYRYSRNGIDEDGERIPDIPVIYLILETSKGRAMGPAVVDTGFDGGIYPNIQILRILRGLSPLRLKRVEHPIYGYIRCEIYRARASLSDPFFRSTTDLGLINIYTPMEPEYISDEVLLGREILNNLNLHLDGEWAIVKKHS